MSVKWFWFLDQNPAPLINSLQSDRFALFHFLLDVACRGNSLRRVKNGSKWRAKEIFIDGKPPAFSSIGAASAAATAAIRSSTDSSVSDLSPALLAQANWTFVEKLLKVCRFWNFLAGIVSPIKLILILICCFSGLQK